MSLKSEVDQTLDNGGTPGKEIPALLLSGGIPNRPSVMVRLMSQAFQGMHKPVAAYIGTASNDNVAFFHMMKMALKKAGAGKVVLVRLAKEKPNLDAAKAALSGADLIFLSGGEVEDGINWLKKHKLMSFLKDLYNSGKRFMGVSAGVIMMGTHWVRWDIPDDDSTSELFDCLGMIPALFDVHGEDEDWVELKAALKLMGDGAHGYALPRECLVSADSRGNIQNLSKEYLVFANEGGRIRIL